MKLSVRAQILCMIILTLMVLSSAISVVYTKHLNRVNFVELKKQQAIKDSKNIEWGQLQLEESTFAASSEIEKRAKNQLNMSQPQADEIVMIRQ